MLNTHLHRCGNENLSLREAGMPSYPQKQKWTSSIEAPFVADVRGGTKAAPGGSPT